MPTKTTNLSMKTNLSRHRKEKSQQRSFDEFISQVATDLKEVVTQLAKAQGLLLAFADYLGTVVEKLTDAGAPQDVVNTISDFQDTVSNVANSELPEATDSVANTVSQLQTVINGVMNLNLPQLIKDFTK